MQIIISENKETWDNFLLENDGSFLQSWDWGEFQLRQAKKVWRLQAKNKQNKIVCEAQVLKEAFPLNKSMLYIPLGPCFKSTLFLKDKKKILNLILKFLKKIAKREGSIFAKVESPVFLPKIENLFPSKRRIQPKRTMVLSLLPQEEEILKKFHSKTRYNIKIAEKKGVNFIKLQNKKEKLDNLNFFWKILQKTARRGKFKTYSRDYYQDMLSFDSTTLYLGQYKKKISLAILWFILEKEQYIYTVPLIISIGSLWLLIFYIGGRFVTPRA